MSEIRPYDGLTSLEQLNLFRNLHYCEGLASERGIVANAVNDLLVQFSRQKSDYENLKAQEEKAHQHCRNVCEPKYKAEIEKLKGAVQEWVDGKCLSQKHLLMIGKLQNEIEQAKDDAVRDFAEEVKAVFFEDDTATQQAIDNLVKEKVGEST